MTTNTDLIAEARSRASLMQIDARLDMRDAGAFIDRLADALEAAEVRLAALTTPQEGDVREPAGWNTEDRQEALAEAERRFDGWLNSCDGGMRWYGGGCVNAFVIGAEWQKARTPPVPVEPKAEPSEEPETAQRSVPDLTPGSEWIVRGHGARVTILEVADYRNAHGGPFVSFRFDDGRTTMCTEASFRDAHEPAPEPDIRARVLRILADKDYNDGGMMRWHPSGRPTEQAERVADRIMREAFNAVGGVR